jgi:hypothetical protein
MSQNQPKASFFQPDQDRLAIDKLSAFRTGLGAVTKTRKGANIVTQEIDNKTQLKNNLSPFEHFTEHLVGVFEELLRENNLDHKSSRLSMRWLKSTPGIQPVTNFTHKHSSNTLITAHN